MITRTVCICEVCGDIIPEETEGVIVHGNIYTAFPEGQRGLLGNSKWLTDPVSIVDVPKTAYCNECFKKALGL